MVDPLLLKFAGDHMTASQAGLNGLFRYSSYATALKEKRHAPLLRDGLLYHSHPEAFNDPFDCKYHIRWPNLLFDSDELRGFVSDMEYLKNKVPASHTMKTLYESSKDILTKENKTNVIAGLDDQYSNARVCCFTSTNNNPLFWAHYGDSHKGYCIRFDVTPNPYSVASQARRVVYSEEYPTLAFPIFQHLEKFLIPLLRKSMEWEYEGEFRSFFSLKWFDQFEHTDEALLLKNDNISDIYFGAKMPESHKEELIELCNLGPFNPRFWDAQPHPNQYELVFVPHDSKR